ncbi:MAG: VWA domain-containing protein [Planctomycetota bacterium]|nr:VWA domain-containing protein [Planctomycetota bacterium]
MIGALAFLAPWWLLLALAGPLAWFVPRRLHDPLHGALRAMLFACLACAAAEPVLRQDSDAEWQVVVLDAHGSTDSGDAAEARARAASLGRAGRPGVLVHVGPQSPEPELADAFERVIAVHGDGSDSPLGQALEVAAQAIPRGARGAITLFSDGHATDRRWGAAAQTLTARGLPVHVVALRARSGPPTVLEVTPPGVLRVGHTATLSVLLAGESAMVDVTLHTLAGVELARVPGVALDGRARVDVRYEPAESGVHALAVRVSASGASFVADGRNERALDVAVQSPLRVQYVGARMEEGGPRLAELLGPGFVFDDSSRPLDSAAIAGADLVVLDDVTAEAVSHPVQRELVDAVASGRTGVVMCGGRGAFGAGGWHGGPLADALPVAFVQKEEKRDPSTSLVVIIDTSGSMGGNRVQLAKEVARLAIRRLLPHDKVGIVEFYGAKRWAAPIQPASNAIEIQRALNRLNAGGGTVIMPAIEEAFYGLQNVRTRYKHVLVLTDGGVEQGAFEPLLRRMADKGITVSTVLIGPGTHSEFLVNLANWGKGRFYAVPNRFNLPEVILKQPAGAQLPSWRQGAFALRTSGAPGWWADVPRTDVPTIAGYVEAEARAGAEVLLEVEGSGHPVAATWRHGLGRASALMTEPAGPATSAWRDWSDYGVWLARLFARSAAETRVPYVAEARRDERGVAIAIRAVAETDVPPRIATRDAVDGPLIWAAVRRRSPDRYEARAAAAAFVELYTTSDAMPVYVAIADDRVPEQQVDPRRGLPLAQLAQATGGTQQLLGTPFVPRPGGGATPVDVVPIAAWFFLAALLALLAELAWRRRPGGVR